MGIFRETKITAEVVIYSKWCIQCDHLEELLLVNSWALHRDLDVQVIRTAYRPADHKRAVQLWASHKGVPEDEAQDYPAFVVHDSIMSLKDFVEMITEEDVKNKLIKEGKTKNDLQGLPQTKRVSRTRRVARTKSKD